MKLRFAFLATLILLCSLAFAIDPWGEPSILTGSMSVMAQVSISGVPAAGGDVVAAFVTVGGTPQLRGKQGVQVLGSISGCLLQVYTESNGEVISFKVWDESAQQVFDVTQTLLSEVNGSVGSYPDNMYQVNGAGTMQTVATPTFNPPAGTYTNAQNVTISCSTAGAQIRYTVNGTEPTETSALYSAPIAVAATTTIKAKAYLTGWTPSATATAAYTIGGGMVTDPWGTPAILTGSMTVMSQVSINSVPATGEDILAAFVTVGGVDQLRGKIPVQVIQGISACLIQIYTESNGEQIMFKVWDYSAQTIIPVTQTLASEVNGMIGSFPDNLYQINAGAVTQVVATPTFNPAGGTYQTAQNVTIACSTAGAQIRYTVNGTEPTETSALYSTPIAVAATTTIKAKAYLAGWTPSATATATYTISGGMVTDPWGTPDILTGSMTVMSQVSINSVPATGEDILAAFVTVGGVDQLRGKIPVQVIQGISACLIQIYTESNGEQIMFKVWDYSAQTIIPVTQTLASEVNGMIGSFPDNLYQINAGAVTQVVATPTFNPVGGTYQTQQSVTIACSTAGAQIRYTTNGTEPTEASNMYTTAIILPLNSNTTIKAKAFLTGWTPSSIATATYVITATVSTPTFSPAAGTYASAQNVTITCSTAGAQIRYTTDGTEPTATSTLYSTAINVAVSTMIKAKAFITNWTPSATASAAYTITGTVAQPTFNPLGGTYQTAQNVTITCFTVGAQIRYTTNGTDPTEASALYSAAINLPLNSTTTIKAKAYLTGWTPSSIATATYVITGTVATPTFSPAAGTYATAQNVTIACTTAGAQIRYTTDGTEPTATSTLYSTPVYVAITTTIKAKGFLTNWTSSATATATYTISGGMVTDPWGAPEILTGSMTVMAQVSINTVPATGEDILAAFVTVGGVDQLRGKTPVLVVQGISGCIIQIYTESNGEQVTFKVWDYSAQTIVPVTQTLPSEVNATIGDFPNNLYPINAGTGVQVVAMPVFNPVAGTYATAQSVSITCSTPGAQIRYTTNGTDPTEASALYSTPINLPLNSTTTIKAKAYLTGWTPSTIAAAEYIISGTVATPTFNPAGGNYQTAQNIVIACTTAGAQIRYTLNGTDPTETSALYSTPISLPLNSNTTVKAKAYLAGWTPSAIASAIYNITGTVAAPVFSPVQGTYPTPQNVTIACSTVGAQIRYTTNGTEPTETSTLYSTPINVAATTTIKAKGFLTNWAASATVTAVYTITGTVATPTFTPVAGTYQTAQNVTIACSTAGAQIRYTTNGTDPTEASTLYTAAINLPLNITTTIKAKAYLTNWTPSTIASATYIITGTVATPAIAPPTGTYVTAQTVTITCATAGAQIRYTTNGTEPTATSTLYSAPFNVATSATVKAKGFLTNWTPSATTSATYTITGTVAMPTFSPEPGQYQNQVDVSLACSTAGAQIRYTLDGTEPVVTSTLYAAPIHLTQTTTIRAKGFKLDWAASETAIGLYNVSVANPEDPAAPVVTGIQDIYPNPFSAFTNIKLGVKEANQAYQLTIYNIKGECVYRTSGNAKGNIELTWNGYSSAGTKLPVGIYLISFSSGSTTQTRKAVLK
jgi:peptidyl-tRNA hydrolase